MHRFLTAKHWQLFFLFMGLPLIMQLSVISSFRFGESMWLFAVLWPISTLLYMFLIFGWFWTIATHLHEKLPDGAGMNLKRFKILFFIPVIYIIGLVLYMAVIFLGGIGGLPDKSFSLFAAMGAIVPLHLFSMFCILHTMLFAAKTIRTIINGRTVGFGDYAGEFFLLWFWPIGIWFVQPRINKIVQNGIESGGEYLDEGLLK